MKKSSLFLCLIGSMGTLTSAIPVLVSCSAKEIKLIFNAGIGHIKDSEETTFELITDNKTKWVDIVDKPEAEFGELAHTFKFWSIDGINEIGDETIFSDNTEIKAVYDVEHNWDGYTVIGDQLYKTCSDCKETLLISDEELKQFENKFAYINNDGDFCFESKDNLTSFIENAPWSVKEIYLFKGTYVLFANRSNEMELFVHGLLDNSGNLMSHIDCYADGDSLEHFYRCFGVKLYLYHVYMDGCDCSQPNYSFYCGIQAVSIKYYFCTFTGTQATYTNKTEYHNCIFDATLNKPLEGRTEYSIYIRNTESAYFYDCQFIDVGKALKIYTDGYEIVGAHYCFENCSFNCVESVGNTKACIAVDSSNQNEEKFYIVVNKCSNEGHVCEYEEQKERWKNFIQDDNVSDPHTDGIIIE